MAEIAKVLSDVGLDREFDYRIPPHLVNRVGPGSYVLVPFGHRKVRGFVVGLAEESSSEYKLKDIIDVIGEKPLIREQIIKLARWMGDYYCAPVENAIRTVLPGAVRRKGAKHKEQLLVRLNDVEDATSQNVEEASSLFPCEDALAQKEASINDGADAQRKSRDGSSTKDAPKNDLNATFVNYFDSKEAAAHLSGNLPHWRQQGTVYFVTFRLADSVPQEKLELWNKEKATWLAEHPQPWSGAVHREYYARFPAQMEAWLDQGAGECILARAEIKDVVESAIRHFDGERYRLDEFIVMPNHVHILLAPQGEHVLSDILHGIKSFSANEINKRLDRKGVTVWQKESFDHIIRSPDQLSRVRQYIKDNPKGLFNVEEASSLFPCATRRAQNEASINDGADAQRKSQDGPSTICGHRGGDGSSTKDAKPKIKVTEKQQAVLDALGKETEREMLLAELTLAAGVTAAPIKALEKKGLVTIEKSTIYRDPHAGVELLKTSAMELMPEQRTSLDVIVKAIKDPGPQTVLLYGVTGSGKTEVYLQSIQQVLDAGQSSIVLVPEIALTPQTVDRFRSRFGEVVAVLHSSLSEGERHDEWARIRNGEAQIVIGARSALFAPVENLGLIVVDEEHEQTYKQDESPRYNARDVAVVRAHMEKCTVVLGSATPSLESYHNVQLGKYRMATMLHRVDDRQMPKINVIDMRLEAQREGKVGLFAKELLDAIGNRLHRTEQVMLFLNRRGFAASLICPSCGYVMECDLCSVGMTYHKRDNRMGCHICGEEKPVPEKCPECGLEDFKKQGVGTERIEEVIQKCFPKSRVFRMDSDTMRKKDAYRKVLADFRAAKIDILIGTQMIAKGLDFPNVTLVGVINADITLHMPDFRAGERTYQLLTQVAGRAGRGDLAGEVIIQTYTPHHQAIQAVRNLGYEQFADQELAFREELMYPPYSHLVCLTLKGLVEAEVEATADQLAEALLNYLPPDVMLSGPAPAPLSRAKGYYRFQVMMRAPRTNQMTIPLRRALHDFKLPKNVAATFDVDAVSIM